MHFFNHSIEAAFAMVRVLLLSSPKQVLPGHDLVTSIANSRYCRLQQQGGRKLERRMEMGLWWLVL